ncbi:family 43 glycosylhydrolase [Rhodobacteraceae bacterium 2CG4]|uniref:Family 43 glycosylhydrolase n=1 Tax=Halovulum marinum TaxID=2662447 RepID=A0A6L5Z0X3_9RHOB|nr:family 43 glycosylhydrolase [Halovulum marinum]MSU90191.1 family 43 glycosylhydrolase [Halovulum marinum]
MIRSPILPGVTPDPTICRAGSDDYSATATFDRFPEGQIRHARDLVNRSLAARPLNRAAQLDSAAFPTAAVTARRASAVPSGCSGRPTPTPGGRRAASGTRDATPSPFPRSRGHGLGRRGCGPAPIPCFDHIPGEPDAQPYPHL